MDINTHTNRFYSNKLALDTLSNLKKSGRICHAYLITGDEGLGKKTFARLFAKTVLCKDSEKLCGRCESCLKADSGNHPDIIVITKPPKKATIPVDLIRDLKQEAYILPNESDYKIYIIENAEDMTVNATNAFLKILEEPPSHTIFLLTARGANDLLDTVVSRCIEIRLSPATTDEAVLALKELSGIDDEQKLTNLSLATHGNIGLALKMLSDNSYQKNIEAAERIATAYISGSEYSLLSAFSCCGKERSTIKAVLSTLLDIFREAILVKNGVDTPLAYSIASKIAEQSTVSRLLSATDIILSAVADIDKNANVALLLSSIVAQIKD